MMRNAFGRVRCVRFLAGASALALTGLVGVSGVAAQAAAGKASEAKPALEEIVVTARRVAENLQKVPISVGTLSAQALHSRQIFNINDLKGQIVGLSTVRTTTPASGYITIRGITNTSLPTPAADNGIGYYIDGVYIARGQGSGTDIPDLARVEVLRGPQGTLFGRNSSAGAVNFITNAPTDRQELSYDLLYGNYDHLRGTMTVNLPLAKDLDLRVVYMHDEMDGDVRNIYTGAGATYAGYGSFQPVKRAGDDNTDAVTAKLRYIGIAGLTVDYKYDYENLHETQGANQIIGYAPGFLADLVGSLGAQPGVLSGFKRLGVTDQDDLGPIKVVNSGHLLTLAYEATDNLTLKNISAYRKTFSNDFADDDGGAFVLPGTSIPYCVSCSFTRLKQHQFSQEDQIIGKFGRLNFILGGYYFTEHSRYVSVYPNFQTIPRTPGVYVPPTDEFVDTIFGFAYPGPYALGENGSYTNRAYAGYAHADYQITDRLKLAVGGRYTTDERYTNDLRTFAAIPRTHVSYHRFTYDAALDFNIAPDKMIYAKYATGYVSGGAVIGIPFKPEDSRQAEVGFKTEFWHHKLRLNAAAYYTWIKNRQEALVNTDPVNGSPTLAAIGLSAPYPVGIFVYNLPGTSTVKGFEIEGSVTPTRGLTLNANFAYNDPHNSDGEKQSAPKTNIALSAQYDLPSFSDGSYISFEADGDYRSKYYGSGARLDLVGTGDVPASLRPGYATPDDYLAALQKSLAGGGYWLANARVALANIPLGGSTKATVSGFVRNIFNDKSLVESVLLGVTYNGIFERPRTYGAEVSMHF